MISRLFLTIFFVLQIAAFIVFLFSCAVTLSDGQGVLIFIFSLPVIALLLSLSWAITRKMEHGDSLERWPKRLASCLVLFFVFLLIPGLNVVPHAFLALVGKSFQLALGKTPYVYFKERNSFDKHLERELRKQPNRVDFDLLGVSFAWDHVCVFGPYTNNAQAREVLHIDWNIEERSEIGHSDSINSLVFLFEGKVNTVIDLRRAVADFKSVDRCWDRRQATFQVTHDPNNRTILN
ncbi:MAG: hypothetical protein U0223_19140 [Nitrospira sp.]